jgi:hypothetical protein
MESTNQRRNFGSQCGKARALAAGLPGTEKVLARSRERCTWELRLLGYRVEAVSSQTGQSGIGIARGFSTLGLSVPPLARLALGGGHRQARDRAGGIVPKREDL